MYLHFNMQEEDILWVYQGQVSYVCVNLQTIV